MPENRGTTVSIPEIVQNLSQYYTNLWWGSNKGFPLLSPTFTNHDQREKGQHLEGLTNDLMATLKRKYPSATERIKARDGFFSNVEKFVQTELGFEERHTDLVRNYRLPDIALEFARKARSFDPTISSDDIYQAGRNVWSMNFMQLLLGLPVELTPSIFAYSMLYPYTDNYLDDPVVPSQVKMDFNHRFSQRLAGETVTPANGQEERIWGLIEAVEGQFDRTSFPLVYDSLAAIQEAQTRSLNLIKKGASPYEVDVLGISIEKGGTAVLADGYLVAGKLNASQREFMFGYGVFTQFMDDQEDVQLDMKAGLNTIFSLTARHWPLDDVTNRAFHFAANVLNCMDSFEGPDVKTVKELFARGFELLLIDAAGRNSLYYSRDYLAGLEKYLPFRFSQINRQRRRLERHKISMGKLMEMGA